MSREDSYDPASAPEPAAWLAEPERERMRAVSTFHMVNRLKSSNAKAHAAIHVIVENQIAMGQGPTVRAMARLQSQGLSRHDSVHAVGSVVSSYMFKAMREPGESSPENSQPQINAALERLTAESWRKEYGA
jgi:hypothetical protein